MNRKWFNTVGLPAWLLVAATISNGLLSPTAWAASSDGYAVAEHGPDSDVMQKVVVENGVTNVSRYTTLATGLNFFDGSGQLVPSSEQITILPTGGAAATQGRHKVYFPGNIYNGVLEVVTPDGRHLKSRPLGVSYDDGSNTVFIATLKSAIGYLTSANTVTYRDAFAGIKADLVCTYRCGGFECDLVFRAQPPTPDQFGLDGSFATIQLVTEFFNTQDPEQIPATSDEWFGLQDSTLKFGKLTMTHGKAFAVKTTSAQPTTVAPPFTSAPVYKSWVHLEGRTFLIEQLPLLDIADDLEGLPLTASIQKSKTGQLMALRFPSPIRHFPAAPVFVEDTNQILLATASFQHEPGVVLDYTTIIAGQTDFTFQSGQTYYVSNYVTLDGTTTIEGGAVIKYSGASACLEVHGPVLCTTDPDHPATFTDKNDDSIGDIIAGSTGIPSGNASMGMNILYGDTTNTVCTLHDVRATHLSYAFAMDTGKFILNNVEIGDGWIGIGTASDIEVSINNGLFWNVLYVYGDTGALKANHVTVVGCYAFGEMDGHPVSVTNSIFAATTYLGDGASEIVTNHVVWLASSTNIFRSAANANYYLATNSPYRNVGTTNIAPDLLAAIKTMTTYAPQDGGFPDTNAPDLGYHYPVNEDSDHDGLPDWWEWKWFGNFNQTTNVDYDNDSKNIGYEYAHGIDPNKIQFSATVTNDRINGVFVPVQLNVFAGVPNQLSVVDSTNFTGGTTWYPYVSSNITVNLDAIEGRHQLWIGLRGLPADARQTWHQVLLTLDTTPPAITITNPTSNTVSAPLLQIQGLANEPVTDIRYDISNAVEVVTNQEGYVTGQFYDTNMLAVTTNYFQCYDVPLTNGVNAISIRVTDLAGNIATTNFNVTLDYSSDTTPPVLAVIWPPDGTSISGSQFTLQAQMDDPLAKVSVMIVDESGNTNTTQGVVQRSGTVWVQHLPLGTGDNAVTVIATDAAGNHSTNSLEVFQSSITVMLNPLTTDQFNQTYVSVSGTVSDTNSTVTVNGVEGTVNADFTWNADGVPVKATGTAVFDVDVEATTSLQMMRQTSMMESASSGSDGGAQEFSQGQPAAVSVAAFGYDNGDWVNLHATDVDLHHGDGSVEHVTQDCWKPETDRFTGYWAAGQNESHHSSIDTWNGLCTDPVVNYSHDGAFLEDVSYGPWANGSYDNFNDSGDYGPPDYAPWGEWDYYQDSISLDAGDGQPGSMKTVLVLADAAAWGGPGIGYLPVPPEALIIRKHHLFNTGVMNSDGTVVGGLVLEVPAGSEPLDVTPVVPGGVFYDFEVGVMDLTTLQPVADLNRDGQLTFDAQDQTTKDKPFRFWINDSKESGDIVSGSGDQISGADTPNYNWNHVQGLSDCVNFFPVGLKLGDLLSQLPPENGFEYHLTQANGAVKFLYTDLTPANAFDYLTNVTAANHYAAIANYDPSFSPDSSGAISMTTLEAADIVRVTTSAAGVTLNTNWLAQVQNNGGSGIILMEGCAETTQPLMLEIWHKDENDTDQKLCNVPMYLKIKSVEEMFRHLNLRNGADAPSSLPGPGYSGDTSAVSRMGSPSNFPDDLLENKWLIFAHGYNVSAQQSRGWEAEMFKRFYWSGSKAKFIGVDWLGNPYGNYTLSDNALRLVSDYHLAVMNAFATAPTLTAKINVLSGSKTIVGHSLGCGLTAIALNDFGLQLNHACLVDAAIASECFDGDSAEDLANMTYSPWTLDSDHSTPNYPRSLWAADWYKQFQGGSDARQTLTWKNRFTNAIPVIHNFYSSTEDVLGKISGSPTWAVINLAIGGFAPYAWVSQEKSKGNVVSLFGIKIIGSDYGGWGFNVCDGYLPSYPVWYKLTGGGLREMKTPADIGTVTTSLLDGSKYNPLFKDGWGAFNGNNPSEIYVNADASFFTGPDWILGLYQPNQGSTVAADPAKNAQLLAQAIPALSLPVGSKLTTAFDNQNYNMPVQFVDGNHWPSVDRGIDPATDLPRWFHSDVGQVAYPYVYKLFNQIVLISNQ